MIRQIIVTIEPHEDGVRCGECKGPLYTKQCDCCEAEVLCHDRMWSGLYKDFVRGPACLAAEKKLRDLVEAGNRIKLDMATEVEAYEAWESALASVKGEK